MRVGTPFHILMNLSNEFSTNFNFEGIKKILVAMVTDQNEVSDNAHRAHDDRIENCFNWLVPSSISVEFLIAAPARIFSCPKCKQSHNCANHTLNFNVHNKSCHKFAPKGNANAQRAPKHFPYKFNIFFSFRVYNEINLWIYCCLK